MNTTYSFEELTVAFPDLSPQVVLRALKHAGYAATSDGATSFGVEAFALIARTSAQYVRGDIAHLFNMDDEDEDEDDEPSLIGRFQAVDDALQKIAERLDRLEQQAAAAPVDSSASGTGALTHTDFPHRAKLND